MHRSKVFQRSTQARPRERPGGCYLDAHENVDNLSAGAEKEPKDNEVFDVVGASHPRCTRVGVGRKIVDRKTKPKRL
jgi:hypothetical protein